MLRRETLFVIFLYTSLFAEGQFLNYEVFDASNGLPSSECISITQDHTSHVWIGTTEGITRYNGYEFENFFESSEGHRFGKVNVIREDRDHNLWIGSDAGLFIQTPDQIFHSITGNPGSSPGVNDICFASFDTLWLATGNGPVVIPLGAILKNSSLSSIALTDYLLPATKIITATKLIACSKDGTMFFSDLQNLYRLDKDVVTTLYSTDAMNDQITAIIPINTDSVYFYTTMKGLFKAMNKHIRPIKFKGTKSSSQTSMPIHTGVGMIEFDPASETIVANINLNSEGLLWPSQALIDRQHNYWIASHDGLYKVKTSYFQNIKLERPEIYSMMQTKGGHFLLGSNRGLIFQRDGESIRQVVDVNPNAEVFGMHEDEDGGIWFASGYEGIAYLKNSKLRNFSTSNGLHNNGTRGFFTTTTGKLFVTGDMGISQIIKNNKTDDITFKRYDLKPKYTQYGVIYGGVEAPDGTIWVAGQEGLYKMINDQLAPFQLENKSISIADVKSDGENIWLAVNNEGLWRCQFNAEGNLEVIDKFNNTQDLPTRVLLNLFIDHEKNIWVSHYQGISILLHNTKKIITYDLKDGWPFRNYHHLFLYQTTDNIMWAGCSKGLVKFNPRKLLKNSSDPVLFLHAQTEKGNLQESFTLPYNQRTVNFIYHAIDFANQDRVLYSYYLEGFHLDWIDAGKNREVVFDQLLPGNYLFHVKAVNNKGGESKTLTISFTIEKPFWKTTWFIGLCSLFLFTSLYLGMRLRENRIRKQEQQNNARELERVMMNRDVARSRLVALRSQMSPHFTFNALNSMQQFILQGNVDEANHYLSLFAQLQRYILNACDQDFILLEKEIEMLDLYLKLEELRSGKSFTYTINVENNIDVEEVKIPPMLVQPFVENSVWHGLMPKSGDKHVVIYFKLENNGLLRCTIEDNGIGRAASKKLKEQNSETKYDSKGLNLIMDRMKLLSQQHQQPLNATIEDICTINSTVCGTRVTLTLPLH